MERLNLKYLVERHSYDPWGHFSARLGGRSSHKPSMENYWFNYEDEFEVQRCSYSRFTLSQIVDFMSEDVEGLSDDDGDVTLPQFF